MEVTTVAPPAHRPFAQRPTSPNRPAGTLAQRPSPSTSFWLAPPANGYPAALLFGNGAEGANC
jgi:hypothetical protein